MQTIHTIKRSGAENLNKKNFAILAERASDYIDTITF